MTTVSIQQFRATLDSRTEQGAVVRAYRELARRPQVTREMAFGEWAAWPTVSTPVASA
jgi:hypothetical protein